MVALANLLNALEPMMSKLAVMGSSGFHAWGDLSIWPGWVVVFEASSVSDLPGWVVVFEASSVSDLPGQVSSAVVWMASPPG